MPGFGQPQMRRFGDHEATKNAIYDGALGAVSAIPPVENTRYSLSIQNPGWAGTGDFGPADHKNALLTGRTLSRRLTGTFVLTDKSTGAVADSRRMTVASVPALTKQGTFIIDGNANILASQLRLLPGVYSRRKANQSTEAHVNTAPGKGVPHRINLDPATGVFKATVGQAEIPVVALMRAMGVTKEDMEARWGKELADINLKAERPHHLDKFYERMGPQGPAPETQLEKSRLLGAKVSSFELDPWVSRRTLGNPHSRYDKAAILATTGKLLDIAKGRAEPDDRDNPIYSMVWGPEHLISERLERSKPLLAKMLWQATNAGNLKRVQPGPLSPAVRYVFTKTGLGLLPEGSSAAEFMDHGARITKVGEGGIGKSAESVPMSARNVSAGQFPFIDPARTSESESVGVDLRVAFGTRLGADRRIYGALRDARTGKLVFKSPQDIADKTVAFPNAHLEDGAVIPVIKAGKLTYADRNEVDYHVPSMEQSFSPMTNLVPIKSASKAHRSSMGARMITQSLPLIGAEAPWVRSQIPGQPGKSFDELYGRHMGAAFAHNKPGVVESVTPDAVTVRYADGTRYAHETHNNTPAGRKTGLTATALVKPGDQLVPGQILAKSNYTDNSGTAAYGLNARVAFMAHPDAFEDAITVSRGFADRMNSDHLYKHELFVDEHTTVGKRAHAAAFPGKYPLETLKAFGDDGVIKPGTVVNKDDPLILGVKKRPGDFGRLSRSGKAGLTDASETWHYDEPGVVTDAIQGPNGPVVVVKTQKVLQSGDKLCYAADTEISTSNGWKSVADVTPLDEVWSLGPSGLELLNPVAVHAYPHDGPMYHVKTRFVDLLVTEDHDIYADTGDGVGYGLIKARDLVGKPYDMLCTVSHPVPINRGAKADDEITDYRGTVHCITLPRNHVLYVQRNGHPVFSGNSGRHGNKGIAVVRPDHEMPHDADGKPVDVILSSLGTVSRANPSAIMEAALGKIVRKTGKPYVFDDFQHGRNIAEYVKQELAANGVNFKEDLTDPTTGRTIPRVATGYLYLMKLNHLGEAKAKGRGLGAVDESGQPTRGQNNGAMRMSLGDTNALLSAGGTSVIHDAHLYRGQANPEFWLSYMAGFPTPKPTVSPAFERFLTELRAAGVDPVRRDSRYHLMALTNKRVKELAGDREVKNGETLDFSRGGSPYPSGLFDSRIFGSPDSTSVWGHVPLHAPLLNPVMEEPARRLLDLTEAQFRDVISGKHSIPTGTGPKAIADALAKIDVKRELESTKERAGSARKTTRDDANRKLVYLKGLVATNQTPSDWVLESAPVLPPGFRPVTHGPGGCFYRKTPIWTENGMVPIGELVDQRSPVRVWSYDFSSKSFVLKPITNWFKNRVSGLIGITTETPRGRLATQIGVFRPEVTWVTPDHQVYNEDGSKQSIATAGSLLAAQELLSGPQTQLLYGSLLGDGHVSDAGVYVCGHGRDQVDYANYKAQVFAPLVRSGCKTQRYVIPSGEARFGAGFSTIVHAEFLKARRICYAGPQRSKQVTTEWLDKVDEAGLAFWYFDDGEAYYERAVPIVKFSVNCFNRMSVETLRQWLRDRWGADTSLMRWNGYYGTRDLGWQLVLRRGSASKILDIVAPYACPGMLYKLLNRPAAVSCTSCGTRIPIRCHERPLCDSCVNLLPRTAATSSIRRSRARAATNFAEEQRVVDSRWEARLRLAGTYLSRLTAPQMPRMSLVTVPVIGFTKNAAIESYKTAYDIEVADTHNYFANGYLVSNSRGSTVVSSDVNMLYKDLIEANDALKKLSKETTDTGAETLNLYDSLKAVMGLGEPTGAKNRERGVKGVLAKLLGDSSKFSYVQQKLLGSPTNLSGRAQALPDPDLDMDQVGIPESVAWNVYHPFVVRRMVRQGVSRADAARLVADKHKMAQKALLDEMNDRPVLITRYPALHRHSVIAANPKLVAGDGFHTNNLMVKSMGGDHDGDDQYNSVILAFHAEARFAIVTPGSETFWESRDMTARFRTALPIENSIAGDPSYYCVRLEDFPRGEKLWVKDHVTAYAVPPGVKVVSYDDVNNCPVLADVSVYTVHEDRVVEIVDLVSGRQIVTDDDERAVYGIDPLTMDFVRRRPSESVGVAVPRVDRFDLTSGPCLDRIKVAGTNIELNHAGGYIFGLYVGNGWHNCTSGQFQVACTDPQLTEAFKDAMASWWGPVHIGRVQVREDGDLGGYGASARLVVSNAELVRVFDALFARGARQKHLPGFYLTGPEEFRKGLLAGLIDTDGSVAFSRGKGKPQLMTNYQSSSLRLVQEIQHLCRSLGVFSTISETRTPAGLPFWNLGFSSTDLFRLGLKLNHSAKSANMAAAASDPPGEGGSYLRNHVVPFSVDLGALLSPVVRKKYGAASLYNSIADGKKKGRIGRAAAKKIIAEFADAGAKFPNWDRWVAIVNDESTTWDQVVSYRTTGIKETGFDLTVPGFETFMSVDGLVLSNTYSINVPLSDEAVKEAREKLLPSKNLFSPASMKATTYLPNAEYVAHHHAASTMDDGNDPVEFETLADAKKAHSLGLIGMGTRVRILSDERPK